VLRGDILFFTDNPANWGAASYRYFQDGVLVVENGLIKQVGESAVLDDLAVPNGEVIEYPDALIMPGFIDTHLHYPQTDIIASYGEHLLQWLEKYTFPAELSFSDPEIATETAEFFLNELLRCGTTSACVYGTVHPQSVEAFFLASQQRNTRMICGKVMMDRNAPQALCDTPESAYQDSRALIKRWHNNGRQSYAVTPRFALTSSAAQLVRVGELLEEFPDLWLQTHIAEDLAEVKRISELFPKARNYLDVYDQFGLLTRRSVFGHGIHLSAEELRRLEQTGAGIAFCPSSNLFLGSGLLDLTVLDAAGVVVSLATDIGAGTSFSMLRTMAEAYKVASLCGNRLSSLQAFYMATLGNARALQLEHYIGSFLPGSEADLIVLDKNCTPLLQRRLTRCNNLEEMLFALMILGDDRAIKATWVNGKCLYEKQDG
jgi:guanine deaminase